MDIHLINHGQSKLTSMDMVGRQGSLSGGSRQRNRADPNSMLEARSSLLCCFHQR